jgi:ubiquinone/menaquinone biosynthesis C-methylase UbiE
VPPVLEPSLRGRAPDAPNPASRYERLWDEYSLLWDRDPAFRRFAHLGDEWGPEEYVRHVVGDYVAPHCAPGARALEIGPGGGRYTARLAPLARSLACVDVSTRMLERVRRRFADAPHVETVHGNGSDLGAIEDGSVDFAFAHNVFVQLHLEDVFGYLAELARVLAAGGRASIHYASLSNPEGWRHFLEHRSSWSADPCQRGRFCPLALSTMDLLAERAGLSVVENRPLGRDAIVVLAREGSPAPPRSGGEATRRDYRHLDRHLDDLAADVYRELPTEHHASAAHDAIDRLVAGLGVESAVELGCGTAPSLDRLRELGVATHGVSLGSEPCAHPVTRADMHFSGLPSASHDLVVARHALEHSPMPLLLLLEIHRITRRYALVVVPCDERAWVEWPNHYSVFGKETWRTLFRRARFRIVAEGDGPLEPASTEWRFLLEKSDRIPRPKENP